MSVTEIVDRSAASPNNWQYVRCPACGSGSARVVHALPLPDDPLALQDLYACTSTAFGRCGPIARCLGCGLLYLNPRPSAAAIVEAYRRVVDRHYEREREGRVRTFSRSLDQLARHRAGGRMLDVGCHVGVFAELAARRGWDAWGVEPSTWAAARARGRGLNVVAGTLREARFPGQWFDAVTLWDVVEHFPEPLAELREVARVLRPGGILGLSTMNVDGLVPRLLGPRWPWFMPMHLVYFSPATLGALLERAGFEMLAVEPHRRVVRLAYLVSRLEGHRPRTAAALKAIVGRLGLTERLVGVDLGDVMTVFARRACLAECPHDDSLRGLG